jgi:UPF0176 protein
MKNVLYYKFVKLQDLEKLQSNHENVCKKLNLLGKVILAPEGINGCLSGEENNIEAYVKFIKKEFSIKDIDIKITNTKEHNFRKLWIKIKPQIIGTKNWNANIENTAEYIEPSELKKLLDNKEEVYIIDARNNYEYDSGHFSNALYPNIKTFSVFHDLIKDLEHLKDKQIVTYCTGGIRCEKASAFLKENGFTNVKQLHGGVINYAKKNGSSHWEGKCLVFDNRNELDMDDIKNFSD